MNNLIISTIFNRIEHIQNRIKSACFRSGRKNENITLLPISKNFELQTIHFLQKLGFYRFGESKVKTIIQKSNYLPDLHLEWIVIGHLQTNKVKYLSKNIKEIHSLDRISLALALDNYLKKQNRTMKILVQVKTSEEYNKHGLSPDQLIPFLIFLSKIPSLKVEGLMTIAENTSDLKKIRSCFRKLRKLNEYAKNESIPGIKLERLSMGMSNDFEIAIEEGSTEVRIGSAISKS
ncbi:MAG: YggS family pyridoxal phosphate-dependent enzyme [Bordetella sp.]|nr:MAG: YggS family pyridoxal phosphate-dependent enzyme [Bordetella sp.]